MIVLAIAVSLGLSAIAGAETINVSLEATLCDSCAREIEKTFKQQSEVQSVHVDLARKQVTVETKNGETMSDLKVIQLLKNIGYIAGKIVRAR